MSKVSIQKLDLDKKYLNSREAAKYIGVKLTALYTYIYSGRLKAYKLGSKGKRLNKRHWRFTIEDLDKFVVGSK